jgi:hypothetical protein
LGLFDIAGEIQVMYIIGKYQYHLHSVSAKIAEKLTKGSLAYLFLKLEQIISIFIDNESILSIYINTSQSANCEIIK